MKSFIKKIVIAIIQWEAVLVLKKYKPKIIAITGNVGKTSTKDAIFTVISKRFFVRRSEKSFNSEIGVPLTILGCNNAWNNPFLWVKNIIEGLLLIILKNHYPKWLVLEVGADRPGDIRAITEWLKPDVVVVTSLPDVPVHIEFFDSVEEVVEEKEALVQALKPEGTLILNYDEEKTRSLKQKYRHTATTFGFTEGATYQASHDAANLENRQTSFRINSRGSSVPLAIKGALGRQHIYPALAAFAVGGSLGLDMATMAEAFGEHKTPLGRMKIIGGVRRSVIIDDTYNSSPAALTSALTVLKDISVSGRKFAVIGDMMELGVHSIEAHRAAGKQVAESADRLITVGVRARGVRESAIEAGIEERNCFHFENSTSAGEKLREILEKGDVALVKGSQSMRMERVVKEAMAQPEDAHELLVRQDREWLRRK